MKTIVSELKSEWVGQIKVKLVLDRRRETGKKFPIAITIYESGGKTYYHATKNKCTEIEWVSMIKSIKNDSLTSLKTDIITKFENVLGIVRELNEKGTFTNEALIKRLCNKKTINIFDLFEQKIKETFNNDKISTSDLYKSAMKHIQKYNQYKPLNFNEITVEWLNKYEKYCIDNGLTYSTIGIYTKNTKHIMNMAKEQGIIKDIPFGKGKYKIPESEVKNKSLKIEEIKLIENYIDTNLRSAKATEKYKDLFLFSYYCNGINYTDLAQLKLKDIDNQDNTISWYRQKTINTTNKKKKIYAPITLKMRALIDKYTPTDSTPNGYIFPILKGDETSIERKTKIKAFIKATNKKMKQIAKNLGIRDISTYTARHSYATILISNNYPMAQLSENLGHTSLNTTNIYFDGLDWDKRREFAEIL